MGLGKSISKRIDWLFKVEFDRETGFYKYIRFDKYVYIRQPRHFLKEKDVRWASENLFFHHYLPKNGDVVLDLGAGYGEEAVYLANKSPNVRYIGVEAQPVIYECLANTFRKVGPSFLAVPYVITDSKTVKFVSHYSYASVGEIPEGYIDVATIKWNDFVERYEIEKIDLFKMNVEGAEKDILLGITDFSLIKRFIISCHDFRANNNEGDWYRTKEVVVEVLKDNGYKLKTFDYGMDWADDWIYAER